MKSPISNPVTLGSPETSETIIKVSLAALVTVTPVLCTACGNLEVASCNLFCTCICATSGLVPALKFKVMLVLPAELLEADMYSRLSRPFSCCSITCVTESSSVLADAPA